MLQHDEPAATHVPVLELQSRISNLLLHRYNTLMQEAHFIPCATTIAQTSEITWLAWKERLAAERLTRKAKGILNIFEKTGRHWEETFWQLLARNFGMKVNGDAFENLAQTVPVKLLAKHKSSIQQLEAFLLGHANLLPQQPQDDYTKLLLREYCFLKAKYNLPYLTVPVHFLRMRPPNFPTIRLAQLAALVRTPVFENSGSNRCGAGKKKLQVTANDYWHYHYKPDEPSAYKPKTIGGDMIDNIMINTVVPVLFAYGLYHGKEAQQEKAILWLQQLSAENNSITKGFSNISISNKTAFDSQVLIELENEYCHHRRCLQCAVGNALLKKWNTT